MEKRFFLSLIIALALSVQYPGWSQKRDISEKNMPVEYLFPTGEFPINQQNILNLAPFEQVSPSIAFNGSVFLAVWADTRSTFDIDIYGARLDASGNLLDPAGILICGTAAIQRRPVVSSNGDIFMVAWEDERNGSESGTDIYASIVRSDGEVLDPGGFAVSTANDLQTLPAIGSAEGNFFVAWADRRSGTNYDIYGTFVSGSGTVGTPDGLALCTQSGWQNNPAIGFDGSRYFIVWADQRGLSKDIYGTFLKTNGSLSHTNGIGIVTLFNNQENPRITWGGTQYFMVWEEYQSGSPTRIHGARVNNNGALMDINGIPIAADPEAACYQPDVTAMDADFFVTYTRSNNDTYDGLAKRVAGNGTVLDDEGIAFSAGNPHSPESAVAFSGTNALVTWINESQTSDIYGTRFNPSGIILDPDGMIISKGYNAQYDIDLAFDGTNYLAVWCDTRYNNIGSIFSARINDGGTVLDPEAIEVASGDENGWCGEPSAAFNGTNYLLVWIYGRTLKGARMSPEGTLLDEPFMICDDLGMKVAPVVATDSLNWLVTWTDGRSGQLDIYGAIIHADGSVVQQNGFPICTVDNDQAYSDVVFAGNQYVVIWGDFRSGSRTNIYAGRVATDGNVLDGDGVAIAVSSELTMLDPTVAFDGTNLMACWHAGVPRAYDIYGIRFDPAMTVLDPQPLVVSNALRDQFNVSLSFTGEHYLAAWMDQTILNSFRISMAKINTDGTIAEIGVLSEFESNLLNPVVVHGPLKQVLLAFSALISSLEESTAYNTLRNLGLLIGQGQGPGIKENDSGIILRFDIYPNPVTELVTVEYELAERTTAELTLQALDGRRLLVTLINRPDTTTFSESLNLKGLPEGMYILTLTTENSMVSRKISVARD